MQDVRGVGAGGAGWGVPAIPARPCHLARGARALPLPRVRGRRLQLRAGPAGRRAGYGALGLSSARVRWPPNVSAASTHTHSQGLPPSSARGPGHPDPVTGKAWSRRERRGEDPRGRRPAAPRPSGRPALVVCAGTPSSPLASGQGTGSRGGVSAARSGQGTRFLLGVLCRTLVRRCRPPSRRPPASAQEPTARSPASRAGRRPWPSSGHCFGALAESLRSCSGCSHGDRGRKKMACPGRGRGPFSCPGPRRDKPRVCHLRELSCAQGWEWGSDGGPGPLGVHLQTLLRDGSSAWCGGCPGLGSPVLPASPFAGGWCGPSLSLAISTVGGAEGPLRVGDRGRGLDVQGPEGPRRSAHAPARSWLFRGPLVTWPRTRARTLGTSLSRRGFLVLSLSPWYSTCRTRWERP